MVWTAKYSCDTFFLFVVFYMGKSVYASFYQQEISKKKTQEVKQKVTPVPEPTSTAFPTTLPRRNEVLFTGDPDPIISCTIPLRCGGSKSIKLSECYSKTCCLIEPNVYEYLEYSECNREQNEYLEKQSQKTKESLEETQKQYNEFIEGLKKTTEENRSALETTTPVVENTFDEQEIANLYTECISNAKQKYALACNSTNVCGDCYGEGCPDTALERDLQTCEYSFGY